jgi:PEGA domain/PDZ domain
VKILFRLLSILALCTIAAHTEQGTAKNVTAKPKPAAPLTDCGTGTIGLQASPDGADIMVDGAFVGNAPANLKLAPGKHSVEVSAPGYSKWQREVSVFGGSETHLAITLKKAADSAPASVEEQTPSGPRAPAPTTPAAPSSPAVSALPPSAPSPPAPPAPCAVLGAYSDEHPKNRGDGVKITGFASGSPAAKAGLVIGDYIVAISGTYVFTIDDLSAELCKLKPGSQVPLRYRRNAALNETTVVLGP